MYWPPLILLLTSLPLFPQAPPQETAPSYLAIPVQVNLAPLFAAAERATPRVPPGVETWINLPGPALGGATYRFNLYRDPLQFTLNGNRLQVDTNVNYWLQVGLRMKGWVKGVGSCGVAPESYRRARLGLSAVVGLTPDWGLDLKLAPAEPAQVDACQLTLLGYDITGKVLASMKDSLFKATQGMEQQLKDSALLRQKVANAWIQAQQTVELGPGVHLQFNPERVRLAPWRSEGQNLILTPELQVRPTLTLGDAPLAQVRPLPPLDLVPTPIQPGFRLRVAADLSFQEATAQLDRQMTGQRFTTDKGSFEVTSIAVRGAAGAVLLEIGLKGRVDGTLTLTGRPRFDEATGSVRMDGLDYTLESQSWITRFGEWLYRSSLRKTLTDRCNGFLDQSFQNLRARAQQGINRDLAAGWSMSGTIGAFTLGQVQVLDDRIRVEALLDGQLQIAVNR